CERCRPREVTRPRLHACWACRANTCGRSSAASCRSTTHSGTKLEVQDRMQELEMASPRRILLIEDDADLREALSDALEISGHTVVSAVDGDDGLRQMREHKVDVVVLDLMMPKLDGWQFRVAQRNDPNLAETPVVVMSASASATAAAVDADLYL